MWWSLTFGLIYFLFRVLGLFGTCISIPRCNSIRTVACRSPQSIFAFMSFTWKWSFLARQMPLTQVPVSYCLVGWHSSVFSVMKCPPIRLDLNAIEHLWVSLEKDVKAHYVAREAALADVWWAMPGEHFRKIVESVPRRMEAIISRTMRPNTLLTCYS